jgi:hypothetical protein
MSNGKIKTYPNPDRNKQTIIKPYVPQYQVWGVEPEEFKSAVVPMNHPVGQVSTNNPRMRRPAIRQPYAETIPSPVGRGRGPIPNVGNNIEHTWSGVDGDIVDDLNGQVIDPNHPMIDNNDFVSAEALGLPPDSEELPVLDEVAHPQPKQFTASQSQNDNTMSILQDMDEEAYLLIVDGVAICSAPLEEIEEQARALVFGEHELCGGNPIPVDDIIVLKKVSIKVGLFLGS